MIPTVEWEHGAVKILDQSLLPEKVEVLVCHEYQSVVHAIQDLKVRGAPAIGVTAAMGLALGAQSIKASSFTEFQTAFQVMCDCMSSARPTAVNLFWAIDRMKRFVLERKDKPLEWIQQQVILEAQAILEEDIRMNQAIGDFGAALITDGQTILTHCNAGALATAGYGTALGVIRSAWKTKKGIRVIADETRPVLQGARLTAWELQQDGIPTTLITDNAAGSLMKQGRIHLCVVGADRIAANGDVANKIGTYSVAVLAKAHGIPFYVAAPSSTIDITMTSGEHIPIEQRSSTEVTTLYGRHPIAPEGIDVLNPAFDVTPAEYITGIITDHGVVVPHEIATIIA
ncbi:MAG: methylthioribose-1-phosphate isomerase [Nitrospirales bacterium]|nr:MAG: methylthioribose-1-phosphate isomerase [Nitrospirales bacterium]